jgi:arsenical pump membrane protein
VTAAGLDIRTLLGLVVFLAVMSLVIARPRGLNEAWPPIGGVVALLALGLLTLGDLVAIGRETAGVLLFLAGMMVVSTVVELAGVFTWAASYAARASGGSGRRLLVNVFLLGALVTALLSLDVTVIILTPIVYATVVGLRVDPLPYLYACTFVANTGSLIFPMSNLTNLLVVNRLNLPFWHFTFLMALPNVVSVGANVAIFLWLFRDRLPARLHRTAWPPLDPAGPRRLFFRSAAAVLALILAGLFVSGLAGWPLWPVALTGAAVLVFVARTAGTTKMLAIVRGISWPLFLFVWGMAAIVRGIEHAGLTQGLARVVLGYPGGPVGSLVVTGGIAALGANLFNNIPMTLVMLTILSSAGRSRVGGLVAATLIGVNIGPALTTVGSLATILWLSLVRRQGVEVPVLEYLRVSTITVPLVLAAALAVLALEGGFR